MTDVLRTRRDWGPRAVDEGRLHLLELPEIKLWYRLKGHTLQTTWAYQPRAEIDPPHEASPAEEGASSPSIAGSAVSPASAVNTGTPSPSGRGESSPFASSGERPPSAPESATEHVDPLLPPEDARWEYRVLSRRLGGICILPILPDGPMLVRLETPVTMQPNSTTSIILQLPAWIRLAPASAPGESLIDVPIRPPARAWYGANTFEGHLCFYREDRACLGPSEVPDRPDLVACPVTIRSTALTNFLLTNVFMRVSALTIYSDRGSLWSDETQMQISDGGQVSNIRVTGTPPRYLGAPQKLSDPRETTSMVQAAIDSTLNFFSNLSPFGSGGFHP